MGWWKKAKKKAKKWAKKKGNKLKSAVSKMAKSELIGKLVKLKSGKLGIVLDVQKLSNSTL